MSDSALMQSEQHMVSEMAETLIGSEIIKLAAEINEKIRNGERIYNYTIGDFDPKIFPIPSELNQYLSRRVLKIILCLLPTIFVRISKKRR